MVLLHVSRAARADIIDILAWSDANFGEQARLRYEALIGAAIRDVVNDPHGPGVRPRPELGAGVHSWHLTQSRNHAPGQPVRQPRHTLIFRCDGDLVVIGRVLHDAMDPDRHLDEESSWR